RKRLRDYEMGGSSHAALIRLLERCRGSGLAVVLVAMPASSPFREIYSADVEGPFQREMTRLAGRYGARFVDLRGLVDDRLFVDASRLGPGGGGATAGLLADALAPIAARHRAVPAALPAFTKK